MGISSKSCAYDAAKGNKQQKAHAINLLFVIKISSGV